MRIICIVVLTLLCAEASGLLWPIILPVPPIPSIPNIFKDMFDRVLGTADAVIRNAYNAGIGVVCAVGKTLVLCKDRAGIDSGQISPVPFQCVGKADVLFVLDSSGSIGQSSYETALAFLANLAGSFQVGPEAFRFGEIIFSNNAQTVFTIGAQSDHKSIMSAILGTSYLTGATWTDRALTLAKQVIAQSARPGVPHIVLTLTDGNSADSQKTRTAATELKNLNAIMMSVGVADEIRDSELLELASQPSYVFKTEQFETLQNLLYQVAQKTCQAAGGKSEPVNKDPVVPEKPKACKTKADIVYVLDSSGSIGTDNYKLMLQFAANISDRFTIGTSDVLFSEIIYGSNVQKMFDFKDNPTSQSLRMAILATPYLRQSTRTDRALNYILNSTMLDPTISGARQGVKKIVILMTDGASDYPDLTKEAAKKVKDQQISILTVGIANANDEELKQIASTPQDVFKANSFDDLKLIAENVIQRTCDKTQCFSD